MSIHPLEAWCALLRAPGLGNRGILKLLAAFGSPAAFFTADDATVREKIPALAESKWRAWQAALSGGEAAADIDWLQGGESRHILTLDDPLYPPLLREIPDPPAVLFVLGDAELLSSLQLGVVGSRQSTPGGEEICARLCYEIAQTGLTVTSGMALGIDAAAHKAALQAGGRTVAVVGTGLDKVYPARHRHLAHVIAEQGAIVSEFPIGTGVRPHHFPQRNRVISGLATGVLVVEATERSGSLITARHAAEQGREVFAVPGSVFSPFSKGCHALIRQGAKLTETAADILEELASLAHAGAAMLEEKPAIVSVSAQKSAAASNQVSEKLLDNMGFDPLRIDDLLPRMDLTIGEISAMLLMLELDGKVQSLPGGRYQRLK